MISLKKIINRFQNKKYKYSVERIETTSDDQMSMGVKKILNLLNYTKTSSVSYSAGVYDSGYHSFEIDGIEFKGQRIPKQRFSNLPISLEGKSVLDLGCNQGGMLHNFANEIMHGVGVDYDSRMINVANKIKSYTKRDNLDFYVFDLEKEDLYYLKDLLPQNKVDVVFMLSIAMWINNWKSVVNFSKEISECMIFETNGKDYQQEEQIAYLKSVYKNVDLVNDKSDDDVLTKNRMLYYCY
jgi:SAM-dependent methyltransferase